MFRRTALALGFWVVACSGKQTSDPQNGVETPATAEPVLGIGGDSDAWRAAPALPTPEIPPFPDRCSAYEIEYSPHRAGDPQPNLECPCVGGFYDVCDLSSCVTSFNCDAVCKSLDGPSLQDCAGQCDVGHDYGALRCIALPGARKGVFSGVYCFDDADCKSSPLAGERPRPPAHCVAQTQDGVRRCDWIGTRCNNDRDCTAGQRCALPDASFLGFCGNGFEYAACFRDSDCRTGAHCEGAGTSQRGTCTTGQRTSPCAVDADCDVGACVNSYCQRDQP